MAFNKDQIQDLLVLRALFFTRVGALTQERKSLMRQMAQSQDLCHVKTSAARLQQNIEEEHQMYVHMVVAVQLGVSPEGPATLLQTLHQQSLASHH